MCSPYNQIMGWVRLVMPELSNGRETFYLKRIGWKRTFMLHIIYQKIDKCPNFCMLYCLENANLTKYKTCGHARYKLITRKGRTLVTQRKLRYFLITIGLQRLFKSPKTNEHITWHHSHDAVDGVMMHSFNGEV